jgi:putative cell wall-binding protein
MTILPRRRHRRWLTTALTSIVATIAIVGSVVVAPAAPAAALNGSDFDPSYIISDSQFYAPNAMSQAEIQAFLNAMARPCTNGNCLNIVRTDTYSRPADRTVCGPYIGAPQETAAAIIFKVQQSCGISAKVLLVMLQKEQGLITHAGPSDSRLGRAMGYACPDNSGGVCDAQFYGLYNQIYKAAWQLKRYSTPDRWGRYYPGPGLAIGYHPNTGCGAMWVAIRNNATAALYNYTPYVPNAAALANLNGTGDVCSSYGNRNFWVYYSSWFGSPTGIAPEGASVERISGYDRFNTSALVSAARGTTDESIVFVANGYNFPDALSGAPAAIHADAPLLLVSPTEVPSTVRTELERITPDEIVVLGGEDSVSAAVYDQLATLAPTVRRIVGIDRYDTSRLVALDTHPTGSALAYLATGEGFADALSASAAAGIQGAPVILVPGSADDLDQATIDTLTTLGVTKVIVTGGTSTVSSGIEADLAALAGMTVERLSGSSRFATASAINRDFFTSSPTIVVASGRKFPDALAGAALAGKLGAALYLSEANCVYRQTAQDMIDLGMTEMIVLGGPDTLATSVEGFLNCD